MRRPLAKLKPAARKATRVEFVGRRIGLTSCLNETVRPTTKRCVRQMACCHAGSASTASVAWSSKPRQASQGRAASTSAHSSLCGPALYDAGYVVKMARGSPTRLNMSMAMASQPRAKSVCESKDMAYVSPRYRRSERCRATVGPSVRIHSTLITRTWCGTRVARPHAACDGHDTSRSMPKTQSTSFESSFCW